MTRTLLVTGGAGFIGSALVRHLIRSTDYHVVNVDLLTYAGHLESVAEVSGDPRYHFEQADIADFASIRELFHRHRPAGVLHLAAESHVDRSIDGPGEFIQTNILGTYNLLEVATRAWSEGAVPEDFRFLHVSTDEVFGSLPDDGFFTEESRYQPRSPYAASKASSDHLVRAWHETYGLPTLVTNTGNNYGPYQFPEKLIPLMILNGLEGKPLPVYGDGRNVRDWIYVEDHVRGLLRAFERGEPGQSYNLGARSPKRNLEVVRMICAFLDELRPRGDGRSHSEQIEFVTDRPGHDFRYAIDSSYAESALGWAPEQSFESGLRRTVEWYLENDAWCEAVQANVRSRDRLGLGRTT